MVLSCHDITVRDGRNTVFAGLSLTFPMGQVTGIYGGSASGKTALLLLLAGLLKPKSGEVRCDDVDVLKEGKKANKMIGLGVVRDFNPLFYNLTVEENLLFQARAVGARDPGDSVRKVLRRFSLQDVRDQMVDRVGAMEQALVNLAVAGVGEPGVYLLDEPELSLTAEETGVLWQHLRRLQEREVTVVLTTRRQETAFRCDRIVAMPEGKAVSFHAVRSLGPYGTETALA
ncbi:Putative ABC transporter [Acididesulfobacillus acetoxydans]|uniref:ABC transporter n=1 Tax=Acididesulfobacillus acetoxydans TaxID=1561005 RepID=A0A8S0VYG9_9FIRM|nr:ATP-binding cassette domain-containing protein [Acididesulfobacillus acetoxydans]CAA7603003.1 Putative ABC transporter [Acididesulfobacillus acetoxydans]CEJ05885.1 ABC transporter [Acididesulfobacillus acetoxydans]